MNPTNKTHIQVIREQFSKQAVPFANIGAHADSIDLLIRMAEANSNDHVLDVACGPGIVACEFARRVSQVTGIDLTDEMIEQAEKRSRNLDISNAKWITGEVTALPFLDESFDVVISRYSFHHFEAPAAALSEMYRVCRKGGRVLVADPVLPEASVEAYNRMEKLRDPSHVWALSEPEFEAMMRGSGLREIRKACYRVEMELEKQLAASFPEPGDADKVRELFHLDVDRDVMGVHSRKVGHAIHFSYPISVYVGIR